MKRSFLFSPAPARPARAARIAAVLALTLGTAATAHAQGVGSQLCVRLESQLAAIDRGGNDPARADQLRRYEEAAARQTAELDRLTNQARRMGCDSSGFLSLFGGQSAQCGPVNGQIQQMRANLDQITINLERLRSGGGGERDGQRRSVLMALAQNDCGPQYANMQRGGGSFLENLFGGGGGGSSGPAAEPGPPSSTFRTVCVRTCDGYYFPISFATVPSRFPDDERACRQLCPASEAALYTYRNPGEDMNQAVSISGQPYSTLPNAFKYRQAFNPACSCKAQGQSWADAMKGVDERAPAGSGDIIVTDERARQMSQPRDSRGRPVRPEASTPAAAQPAAPASGERPIRSVGPTFVPAR